MKLYDLGLVVGRFQMFHKGHEAIIKSALEICNRVVVFIGSSQKCNTNKNPFSYYVREAHIEKVFPVEYKEGKILVRPLPDIGVGNNEMWGKYILGVFEEEFGKQPDLYVTGCEKERPSWFTNEIAPSMDELRISRSNINISASNAREALKSGDVELWKQMVPYQLYKEFEFCERVVKEIKDEDN